MISLPGWLINVYVWLKSTDKLGKGFQLNIPPGYGCVLRRSFIIGGCVKAFRDTVLENGLLSEEMCDVKYFVHKDTWDLRYRECMDFGIDKYMRFWTFEGSRYIEIR